MLFHIDASHGAFAHAHAGSAVSGDEASEELKQVRIVSDDQNILPVCIFVQQLLEVRVGGVEIERRTNLDFAFVTEFIAHKLCGLQRALKRAGQDDIGLNLERAQDSPHDHALFFSFGDQTAFSVEFRAFAGNSGIGMPHEVEVHMRGWARPGGLNHFL